MPERFEVPDELSFLESFGVEPLESAPEDGYWCYRLADGAGGAVRLSFNVLERSLQTIQEFGGVGKATVSCEGAVSLRLADDGTSLNGECRSEGSRTTLELQVMPHVEVTWATLVV